MKEREPKYFKIDVIIAKTFLKNQEDLIQSSYLLSSHNIFAMSVVEHELF